jgi:hypothetical protein
VSSDQVLTIATIVGISLILTLVIAGAILYASYRNTRRNRQQRERLARTPPIAPPPAPPPLPEPEPVQRIQFGAPYEASPPAPGKIQWDDGSQRLDTDPLAVRCPICRRGVIGGDIVRCAVCGTVYHRECWEYVSGACPNCRTQ